MLRSGTSTSKCEPDGVLACSGKARECFAFAQRVHESNLESAEHAGLDKVPSELIAIGELPPISTITRASYTAVSTIPVRTLQLPLSFVVRLTFLDATVRRSSVLFQVLEINVEIHKPSSHRRKHDWGHVCRFASQRKLDAKVKVDTVVGEKIELAVVSGTTKSLSTDSASHEGETSNEGDNVAEHIAMERVALLCLFAYDLAKLCGRFWRPCNGKMRLASQQ